jgi:signal transduction histidine kinase
MIVARSARRIDDATTEIVIATRADRVEAARRAHLEDHMALLHDTLAATLTAAASRGPTGPELPLRARADLSRLAEEFVRDGPVDDLVQSGSLSPDALTVVAPGGTVRVTVVLPTGDDDWRRLGRALGKLPLAAARALAGARDEALRNVERHAGTRIARVEVRAGVNDGVALDVIDQGRGFDVNDVITDRFGLRLSVVSRMQHVGGSARIVSAPGQGTRVELRWPAEGTHA